MRYALLKSLKCRVSENSHLGACEAYGVAIASIIVAVAVDGSTGGSNVELVGDGAGAGEGDLPEKAVRIADGAGRGLGAAEVTGVPFLGLPPSGVRASTGGGTGVLVPLLRGGKA